MSLLPTPEDQAYSRGYREACEFYQPQIDCLKAEIERLNALIKADGRVIDENISEIANLQAVVDAQANRLRTVMRNEPIASYELRCDVADQLAAAVKGEKS